MSNVSFTIGGRAYTLACPDGEEAHLTALGQMVDAKVTSMGNASQTETRMLLFASLMLADEIHEARATLALRSAEVEHLNQLQADLEQRIEHITLRLEAVAALFDTQEATTLS